MIESGTRNIENEINEHTEEEDKEGYNSAITAQHQKYGNYNYNIDFDRDIKNDMDNYNDEIDNYKVKRGPCERKLANCKQF